MGFPASAFRRFCSYLYLNSKEQGRCCFTWNGSQERFVREVLSGLTDGIHRFVVCKARQLGITTVGLALDLFWLYTHRGVQGALAVPDEGIRDKCREILDSYIQSLPDSLKVPTRVANRKELRLVNHARLAHLIAAGKDAGRLGRSEGLNFLHATEVSSWSNEEGLVSLDASLAETHPDRLYLFESTARGYNVFYDMWRDAERSKTTRAIFIGWWARQEYSLPRDGRLWPTYHRKQLTGEEQRLQHEVLKRYGHEITPEQWAWWRWKWAEKGGSKLLFAEFPFTAEQAFVMTGEEFFPLETLEAMLHRAEWEQATEWSYRIGARFELTELSECPGGSLQIWEEPDPNADYVLGCDPAYGESEWADCFCIQVFKCSRDELVQVAEFNTPDCTMYGFAWVIAHLAGAYSTALHPPTVILELGGPGRGVLQELDRMPEQYSGSLPGLSEGARNRLSDFFGSIQHYLYSRPDSLSGGKLLQWETTFKTKMVMMNNLRDLMERRMITLRSTELIEECRYVTQNGNQIRAEGRTHKDDRVIAAALAAVAWQEQVRPAIANVERVVQTQTDAINRSVSGWLAEVTQGEGAPGARSVGAETWQE